MSRADVSSNLTGAPPATGQRRSRTVVSSRRARRPRGGRTTAVTEQQRPGDGPVQPTRPGPATPGRRRPATSGPPPLLAHRLAVAALVRRSARTGPAPDAPRRGALRRHALRPGLRQRTRTPAPATAYAPAAQHAAPRRSLAARRRRPRRRRAHRRRRRRRRGRAWPTTAGPAPPRRPARASTSRTPRRHDRHRRRREGRAQRRDDLRLRAARAPAAAPASS